VIQACCKPESREAEDERYARRAEASDGQRDPHPGQREQYEPSRPEAVCKKTSGKRSQAEEQITRETPCEDSL
jgi:hypothetical protein